MKSASTNGAVHEASPRNGTRPKRPVSAAEAPSKIDRTAATKSTISSSSRTIQSGGTTKPPARAPPNTNGLRSKTSAISSSLSTRDRQSRASIDPVASPLNQGLRASKKEDGPGKVSSSVARPGSASPLKRGGYLGSKQMTNSQSPMVKRMAHQVPGNPRSSFETPVSHSKGNTSATKADAGPQEPASTSTKAASASPLEETNDSKAPPPFSLPSLEQMRPTLGTRKSTKSVTIEQRLQEMSIVHEMLRVAMAEDGNGDEQMQEVHGKEMDKNLAMLKDKLKATQEEEVALSTDHGDTIMSNANTLQHSANDVDSISATPAQSAHGPYEAKPRDERLVCDQLQASLRTIAINIAMQESSHSGDEVRQSEDNLSPADEKVGLDFAQRERRGSELRDHLLQTINEKDNEISSLRQVNENLVAESRHISASKCAEIADLYSIIETIEQNTHASYEQELRRNRNSIANLEKQIEEYEAAKAEAFLTHKKTTELLWHEKHELQCNKDREICQQREAYTALQNQVRSLNESLDREQSNHKAALDAANAEMQRVIHDKEKEMREQHEDDGDEICYLSEEVQILQDQLAEMKDSRSQEIDDIEQRLAEEYEDIISGLDKAREESVAVREAEWLAYVANCYGTLKIQVDAANGMRAKLTDIQGGLIAEQATCEKLRDDMHMQKTEHEREAACLKEDLGRANASIKELEALMAEGKERTESLKDKQQTAQSALTAPQMESKATPVELIQEYEARLELAAKQCQKQLSARDAQLRAAQATIESLSQPANKAAGGKFEHCYVDPGLGFGQFYPDGRLPSPIDPSMDPPKQESAEELQLQLAHAQETAREALEKLKKLEKVHEPEWEPPKSPQQAASPNKNGWIEPASPNSPVSSRKSKRRARKDLHKNDEND
ncbi:MAG: hypothetical protein Q9174_001972, partial [Haloplaca sp. 1 TL-2023]